MKKSRGTPICMGLCLTVFCLLAVSMAAGASSIGWVHFEFLFNAHPEYEAKNDELQVEAEQLTEEFQQEAALLESEGDVEALAADYERRLEQIAEQLRGNIVEAVRAYVERTAAELDIDVVLPENVVIVGGVNLTERVIEMMYEDYGISVPRHIRQSLTDMYGE